MRIVDIHNLNDLRRIMEDISVDRWGIKIMRPKALAYLIKINSLSNISANILKQEMLSLGGDVAVARGALTGRSKKTDCLLMGNLAQINRLNLKLKNQPFDLGNLSRDISLTIENYRRRNFSLDLGRYKLNLKGKTRIMGVLNLTPDSFSGDGLLQNQKSKIKNQKFLDWIVEYAQGMVRDGADIIDIGGESSRPGARPVTAKQESMRVVPVIRALAKKIKVPISIDTCKPQIAKAALENGASIVNDISGLRSREMAKLIARHKAAVVIMHMKGTPATMQKNAVYQSLIDEVIEYLKNAIEIAAESGIDKDKIIVDPGIGFAKTFEHNLLILRSLRELRVLGKPILVGASRKSFLGKILNLLPQERLFGTVSACVLAAKNGANIVRVHDVRQVKQAIKVFDAIDKAN